MRKLLLALPLLLTGCDAVTTQQIQDAAVRACGFLPTAIAVAGFIPQASPFAQSAGSIGQAICDAVKTQAPVTAGGRLAVREVTVQVQVNGTVAKVSGHFVRR